MATNIHPSAIVSQTATLAQGCTIGPYCIVGDKVAIGSGTRLQSHVVIDGNTTIGQNCEIFPFACVGKQTQDLKYRGGLGPVEIGDNTTLREYVTVHTPTDPDGLTKIGNACHILAYSHIAHDCVLGNRIIMSNGTNLGGHVVVEDAVVFGGLCGVHQFVRIGTMAMLGAMSKATQDIAPYSLAEGNPAVPRMVNKVGLSRNGLDDDRVRAIVKAHKLLFHAGLTQGEALEQLEYQLGQLPEIEHLIAFAQSSERGLARPKLQKGKNQ
ncbi:MAG: acyl-ACP--UDP-N-acetylglucosamine O-acyltransferase [Candidatus Pacebacteria bacterium]|nr:acyl-ACP--UDP-N-acetylglucosamine O-acyltransferase [Candidatus Paceibacterota bacterium]